MSDYLYSPGDNRSIATFFRSMARQFSLEFGENTRDVITLYDTYDQSLARKGFLFARGQTAIRLVRLKTFSVKEFSLSSEIRKDWWKNPSSDWEQTLEQLIPLQSLFTIWSGVLNRRMITMKNRMLEPGATVEVMTWGREPLVHIYGNKRNRMFLKEVNDYLLSRGFLPWNEPWSLHLMKCKGKPVCNTLSLESIMVSPALPVRRAVGDIILQHLHIARYYERGIIEDTDTECLHQYRVHIRKIRSILGLLKNVFPPDDIAWLKNDFRLIQQKTNALRDLDVQTLQSDDAGSRFPVEVISKIGVITEHVAGNRTAEFDNVHRHLSSEEYAATMMKLERYFETLYKLPETAESIQPVGVAAKRILGEIYGKVRKKSAHLCEDTPDEVIHRLRINTKKIRYIIEFFQPVLPLKPTGKFIRQMKRIQTILGEFNDLAVQSGRLLQEAEELKPSGDKEKRLLTLGIMIGCLYTRGRYLKRDVLAEAKKLQGESIRSLIEKIMGNRQ